MDVEFSEAVRSIGKLLIRAVSFPAVILAKACYTILIAPVLSSLLFPFVIAWRLVTWPIEVVRPYYDDIFVLAICSLILGVISLFISTILILVWVLMLSLSAYCFPWLSSAEDEQTEPPPPADWRSSRQGPKHRQQRRQQHNLERPLYHRSSKSGRTSTSKAQPYYPLQDEPLSSDQTSPTASSSLFNNVGTSESYSPLLAVSGDLDSDSDLSPPSVRDKGAALRSRRRRRWVRRAMAQPSQSAAATEGLRRRRTRTALGNRVEVDDTIHEDSLSG